MCVFCENEVQRDTTKLRCCIFMHVLHSVLPYREDVRNSSKSIPTFYQFFQRGEFLKMQFKKSKTFLAAILAAAMTCTAVLPTAASAAGSRTKEEAYGDDSYAARFMSLYDDVITNGVENGYMSSTSTVSGGLGVPYHSVEELCIEAPDYGHETTSEALSYLVWAAAMRDNIVNDAKNGGVTVKNTKDASTENVGDLAKAWKTMEATMIPDVQNSFMSKGSSLSATYSDEWEQIEMYPTDMAQGNNAVNPIHQFFCNSYGSDKGLYLMHWLADVDDWYGFGAANGSTGKQTGVGGSFTLINTFQRGEQESCWETIPHACVDLHNKGYGLNGSGGMKGFFNTEASPAEQYSYTNAPDAEDRAIQAVYAANRWGVGDQSVDSKWGGSQDISVLAGKMGDELRNNMYDKYYKEIGTSADGKGKWNGGGSDNGKHYLMNWYTSWGGGLGDATWAWQIGASHMHEFYQNPLAAYALLNDDALNAGMKSQGATDDYTTSLERQIEMYLWLLSADGPIAGGCTNSWKGRYEQIPSDVSTFYKMGYLEHPVYADPGSNHWIGNQVWAVQRLAELYYVVKAENGDDPQIAQTGLTLSQALETILDKWVGWFMDNTILGTANATKEFQDYYEPYDTEKSTFTVPDLSQGVTDDGESFSIPASMIWKGQPETWTGKYQENSGLTCTITAYGDGDLGCVSSLANSLIYYAKAKGVATSDMDAAKASYEGRSAAASTSSDELAKQGLYLAKELLDREWNKYRDDIGLGVNDHNTNLPRLWNTKLALPDGSTQNGEGKTLDASRYTGTMPNGDAVKNGVAFVDIRSNYKNSSMYQEALSYYEKDGNCDNYYFTLHRFWHAGDIMMALGTMYELYPDMPVGNGEVKPDEDLKVTPEDLTVKVGETGTLKPNKDGCTFESADPSIATVDEKGVVTGVAEGETTVTVKDADGKTATVKVTVTDSAETTETTTATTESTTTESTGASSTVSGEAKTLLGDTNLDGRVDITDAVLLNKKVAGAVTFNDQANKNADCYDQNGEVTQDDAISLLKFLVHLVKALPEVQ